MPPTRRSNMHVTRTRNRAGPLPRNKEDNPKRSTRNLFTLDGLVHGWQYKVHYEGSDVPEFSRKPNPGLLKPTDPRYPLLTLKDLECVKTLGAGGYGEVLLVQTNRNTHPFDQPGRLFALKTLRKKHIRYSDENEPDKKDVERSILCTLPWDPFVNGIVQTFYDSRNLYLMLEFIPSGTLRSLIQKRAPFDPTTIAFYFANIVCALDFLEMCGIVHRDIKPDNILVGADGYLCLADFGSAARPTDRGGWQMNGTTAYMAPETVAPTGQSECIWSGVDWWPSGCILYEMITKKMPFRGRAENVTFKRLLSGHYDWPPTIRVGKSLKSLVAGLLTVDASKRLGTHGAAEVKEHPFFKDVVWDTMYLRQYLAPYIPPVPHPTSTWHNYRLPKQSHVPGLKVITPPLHLEHDNRFPPLKDSLL